MRDRRCQASLDTAAIESYAQRWNGPRRTEHLHRLGPGGDMPALLMMSVVLLLSPDDPAAAADVLQAIRADNFMVLDTALQSASRAGHATEVAVAVDRELATPVPAVRHLAAYALSELDRDRAKHAVPAL